MKQLIYLLFLITTALSTSLAQPITDVIAVQKDNSVEITYTLEDGCPADISIYYCIKDCSELKAPLINVTGDVGMCVSSGKKKAVWNVLKDQDTLIGNDIIFQVKGERHCTEFTDDRDGKIYKTVKIENQIWMAENLAYKSKSYNCRSFDNDFINASKYGYLYSWRGALIMCPSGWHLPLKDDFISLINNIKINYSNPSLALLYNGSSGFAVYLAGWFKDGKYFDFNSNTHFWTATKENGFISWAFTIDKESATLNSVDKEYGIYVRCLKNYNQSQNEYNAESFPFSCIIANDNLPFSKIPSN